MDQIDHLSVEQLREYAEGTLVLDESHPAVAHLRICPACQKLLAMSRRSDEARRKLQQAGFSPLTAECLTAVQIGELATGIAPVDHAPMWLSHAGHCDYCGTALRSAVQDLNDTASPDESELLAGLTTATPLWQSNFAQRLAADASPRRRMRRNAWIPIAIAASLAVAAITGWRVLPGYRASRVESLLAQAYTQQRPFDFRMNDDGYAPVTQLRAGVVSTFDRPNSLLDAQSRLASEKSTLKSDPRWLRLRANAELLDLNPEAAISALEQARGLAPNDVNILEDLAIAHAVRGDAESRPVDFAAALDLLTEALRLEPQSKRALFNRGLVLERLLLLNEAAQDFRRYLDIDRSGGWADEARRRLQDLDQRRSNRESRYRRLGSGPEAFLEALHGHDPPSADAWIDRSALSWLSQPPTPTTDKALKELSVRLESQHKERWLADLLKQLPYPSPAYARIFAVVEANVSGSANAALQLATEVAESPELRRAPAAQLRMRYERVYALHRAVKPDLCRDESARLLRDLDGRNYQWLQAQTQSENAICTGMLGDEGTAVRLLNEADRHVSELGMEVTALRVRGVRIGTQTSAGDPWTIWNEGLPMLRRFWTSESSPNRLQQITLKLSDSCAAIGLPRAAYLFARTAANALATTPNRLAEAVNRVALASLARRAGFDEEGLAELKRAREIFSTLPEQDTVSYRYLATLDAVEADIEQKKTSPALKELAHLAATQPEPPTFLLGLKLHQLRALAQMQAGRYDDSAENLDQGVRLLRARMESMKTARERLRMFEASASIYRTRAEVELARNNPDAALRLLLELYGSPGGARPQLASRTLLLFDALPNGIASWSVGDSGVRFHRPALTPSDLERTVSRLRALAADPSSDLGELRQISRQLYDDLVAPLLPDGAVRGNLVVLAGGAARPVPFHLLKDPSGRYLADAATVTYSTGLSRDLTSPLVAPVSGTVLIGLSPTAPAGAGLRLPALTDAPAEAAHVATMFRTHTLLRGEALSFESLRHQAPEAELFHFSGHGFSNAGGGGLLLSASGELPLTAARIAAMNWSRCRLAVLSACLSGTGEARTTIVPDSLIQSFLTAGARGVLAASWSIESGPTRRLMEIFYDSLSRGASADVALRQATAELRSTSSFAHPFYWGAFQLYR